MKRAKKYFLVELDMPPDTLTVNEMAEYIRDFLSEDLEKVRVRHLTPKLAQDIATFIKPWPKVPKSK
jgi:hypothetical protein